MSPDGQNLKLDEFLHYTLFNSGYSRILFYSHKGLYFYDKSSRDSVIDGARISTSPHIPKIKQKVSGLARAPGGISLRSKKKRQKTMPKSNTKHTDKKMCYPDMAKATEIPSMLRTLLIKEKNIKTAVIFDSDHFHDFEQNHANMQQFKGLLETDMFALETSCQNIIIFIFRQNAGELCTYLNGKPWAFLLQTGQNVDEPRGIAKPVCIGPPEKDEVKRLFIQYYLLNKIEIDWLALAKVVDIVTAAIKEKQANLQLLESWLMYETVSIKQINTEEIKKFLLKIDDQGDYDTLSAMERFNAMQGMQEVKEVVFSKIKIYQEFLKNNCRGSLNANKDKKEEVKKTGRFDPDHCKRTFPDTFNMHLALKGNPGTGKTTIAKLIGKIYQEEGLLEVGHTVKVTKKDLEGQFVGHTVQKTADKINQAMGGVLFIDEAYSLLEGGENNFGIQALTTIL